VDWTRLIEQVRRGDPLAGPLLINSLAGRLDRYAEYRAKDLSQADREDAVERALAKIVENIDSYDPGKGSFLTWARAIVRREIAEARRTQQARPDSFDALAEGLATTSTGSDPTADAAILAVEGEAAPVSPAQVAIAALVLQLPPADISLIEAHVLEGLTFPEIAEQLGPPATADNLRQRFSRIRKKLVDAGRDDPDLAHLYKEGNS
jgi:RNA polymerase sigma factor (sigma-70 family)